MAEMTVEFQNWTGINKPLELKHKLTLVMRDTQASFTVICNPAPLPDPEPCSEPLECPDEPEPEPSSMCPMSELVNRKPRLRRQFHIPQHIHRIARNPMDKLRRKSDMWINNF